MNNIENLIFNEFITRFNVSPDMSLWIDEILEEWLNINPDKDINAVMQTGTPGDKKELKTLYKTEVISKNKKLHIGLLENEGVYTTAPPTPQRRFYIYAD